MPLGWLGCRVSHDRELHVMAGFNRLCVAGAKRQGLREMDALIDRGTAGFEGFRFDVELRRLLRQDVAGEWAPVLVGSRALDVLGVLVRQPGALVTKDAIMRQVWPGIAVEANNLTRRCAR